VAKEGSGMLAHQVEQPNVFVSVRVVKIIVAFPGGSDTFR
jgi:hypothetical protein